MAYIKHKTVCQNCKLQRWPVWRDESAKQNEKCRKKATQRYYPSPFPLLSNLHRPNTLVLNEVRFCSDFLKRQSSLVVVKWPLSCKARRKVSMEWIPQQRKINAGWQLQKELCPNICKDIWISIQSLFQKSVQGGSLSNNSEK